MSVIHMMLNVWCEQVNYHSVYKANLLNGCTLKCKYIIIFITLLECTITVKNIGP